MRNYGTENKRGKGAKLKGRNEINITLVLPPKYAAMLDRIAQHWGLNNNSEIGRRLLAEKDAQLDARAAVFDLVDRLAARRTVTAKDIQRLVTKVNWRR